MLISEILSETATAGGTSAGAIATVINPNMAIGPDRGNKSYTGSPGKPGTRAPKVPKVVQIKTSNGTAKNALDINSTSLFGQPIKR